MALARSVIPDLTPKEVARFYSKVHLGGCGLTWAGPVNNNGYGRFEIYRGGKRVRILAHRLIYKLTTGSDLGCAVARHGCDTPPCCTPDCLTPGTDRENVWDAINRGRLVHRKLRVAAAQRLDAGVKRCRRCREVKALAAFSRHSKRLDGLQSECRICLADRKRELREKRVSAEQVA
jgi:hypothetical protein